MAEHVMRRNVATVRPRNDASATESTPSFWRFAGAGAFGGLGAFLLGRLTGAGPFVDKPAALDLPAEIVLGAMAALFAIYLLAKSDVTAPQTVIFAILCGLCWNPVIAGAKAYVQQYADNQATGDAASAGKMSTEFRGQSGVESQKSIAAATSQITSALKRLPDVKGANSRQAIVDSSTKVINNIPAMTASPASVEAIKNIGLASVRTNAPSVSVASYKRLREIAASAPSASTRTAADQAAATLAKQSPIIAALKQ